MPNMKALKYYQKRNIYPHRVRDITKQSLDLEDFLPDQQGSKLSRISRDLTIIKLIGLSPAPIVLFFSPITLPKHNFLRHAFTTSTKMDLCGHDQVIARPKYPIPLPKFNGATPLIKHDQRNLNNIFLFIFHFRLFNISIHGIIKHI